MRKKFTKILEYWQRVLAQDVFGGDDDCVMSALRSVNPEVDESSLTIRIEAKNKVYLGIKSCRNTAGSEL